MLSVYINYPNPEFSIRHGETAESRRRHQKPGQRYFRLTPDTFSASIRPFIDREVTFGASAEVNDAWIDVDFGDSAFEEAIVRFVQAQLGSRYPSLRDAPWR